MKGGCARGLFVSAGTGVARSSAYQAWSQRGTLSATPCAIKCIVSSNCTHTHTYAASPPTELIATHQQNQISTIFGSWVSTVRSVCRAWRSSTARSSSQPWASRVRTLYGYSAVSHRLVRHCAFICLLITYGVSDYSRGFWD